MGVFRLFHTLELGINYFVFVSLYITIDRSATPEPGSFKIATSFIFAHGIISLLVLGFGQPLCFMLHLPLHVLSSTVFLSTLGLEVCRQVKDDMMLGIERASEWLNLLAKWAITAMYPAEAKVDGWVVHYPCLQMSLLIDMYIGFVVVSYVAWLLERKSRVAFVKKLPPEDRPEQPIEQLGVFSGCIHCVLLFVAFGISWRVFLEITPCLAKWGGLESQVQGIIGS